MHLCYAVTSDGTDPYANLAYISAMAARMVHQQVTITACLDELTVEALKTCRSKLLDVVDHVVTIQTGLQDAKLRSRVLKTRSREVMQGDYLQIDADAIPIKPLNKIFALDCDLALALDRNMPAEQYKIAQWVTDLYGKLDWTWDKPRYFNGGVVLFRDTPMAHRFATMWHERWQQTVALGRSDDQPSLNSTIAALQPRIAILPREYNLLISANDIEKTRTAAVLHFFALGRADMKGTILADLLQSLVQTGQMDEQVLKKMIRTGYAWSDPYYVSLQWRSGNYWGAVKAAAVKAKRRVLPGGSKGHA